MFLLPTKFKLNLIISLFALTFTACHNDSGKSTGVNQKSSYLWVDETKKYLPVTGEWTNRVEVADINGDGLLDIIFANGGDYSGPGTLEASRIFINQGPDTLFKEVTYDIFGSDKFYARVIKV